MTKLTKVASAATLAVVVSFGLFGTKPVQAHDSNTLHKIGNAIQSPVRKAGEDISVAVHRGNNKKSVTTDRKDHAKYVVRPGGSMVFKSGTSRHHRARKHHHHTVKM